MNQSQLLDNTARVIKEREKFKKWFKNYGYHFKPENDDESDWYNVVRYWSWKAWEARANEQITIIR